MPAAIAQIEAQLRELNVQLKDAMDEDDMDTVCTIGKERKDLKKKLQSMREEERERAERARAERVRVARERAERERKERGRAERELENSIRAIEDELDVIA